MHTVQPADVVYSISGNADVGQIGSADSHASWPVIQLYDLTIENFDVVTNKPEQMK